MNKRKEVRLIVTAKNNLIMAEMEARNIYSVAELCRQMDKVSYQTAIGQLINMKIEARTKDDGWRPAAQALAAFFKCLPEDLFTEEQQWGKLKRNVSKAEVSFAEMQLAIGGDVNPITSELITEASEFKKALSLALHTLLPREERVLRLRFGFFDGREWTLEEVAQQFNLSKDRIRQIEAKALRKLKHPAHNNDIVKAAFTQGTYTDYDGRRKARREIDPEVMAAMKYVD